MAVDRPDQISQKILGFRVYGQGADLYEYFTSWMAFDRRYLKSSVKVMSL